MNREKGGKNIMAWKSKENEEKGCVIKMQKKAFLAEFQLFFFSRFMYISVLMFWKADEINNTEHFLSLFFCFNSTAKMSSIY